MILGSFPDGTAINLKRFTIPETTPSLLRFDVKKNLNEEDWNYMLRDLKAERGKRWAQYSEKAMYMLIIDPHCRDSLMIDNLAWKRMAAKSEGGAAQMGLLVYRAAMKVLFPDRVAEIDGMHLHGLKDLLIQYAGSEGAFFSLVDNPKRIRHLRELALEWDIDEERVKREWRGMHPPTGQQSWMSMKIMRPDLPVETIDPEGKLWKWLMDRFDEGKSQKDCRYFAMSAAYLKLLQADRIEWTGKEFDIGMPKPEPVKEISRLPAMRAFLDNHHI